MLKKLQLLTLLLAIGLISFGQKGSIITETFEDYNASDFLVLQANSLGNDYWDTWSSSPGSAEDPMVSDVVAFTGSNSAVIEGTNDAVLLFGNKTEGKYSVSFNIYVADGFFGYFNLLQDFAGTNSQWGMQAYFDAGGLGLVDAGAAGAGTFTFSYDTWTFVELIVDLDTDFAQMFVEDDLIVEWQWSTGSFGTGTLNQLGAMNLYAWAENGTPKAYFDDIDFSQFSDVELYDDFEAYTSGQQLVVEALANGIDYWDTWSGSPGSAEDPYITSDQAASGSNSVVIEGTNDAVCLFGNKVSGAYDVEFKIFIPSGFFGYFNLLQDFAGTNSQWGTQTYFDAGGLGLVDAGAAGSGVFNFNYDEWIDVKVNVDLNEDWAEMFVNGTSVVTWQWSTGAFGTGTLNQLGAMNLYAWAENGTPKCYFDDVTLTMTGNPGGEPEIVVSPTSLDFELDQNQSDTDDFTITNIGLGDLEYTISVLYNSVRSGGSMAAKRSTGEETAVLKSQITLNPADIAVDPDFENGAPYNNSDDEVILNYDGENNDAIGLTSGGTFQVSAMFPASMVGQYTGMELTEMEVYINDGPDDMVLKIYGQGTATSPGALIYEQAYTPTAINWNYITLDTPVAITGGDIWVGYEVTHQEGTFVAGTDAGPAVLNGDWISTGGAWDRLSVLGLDYNWNIRAKLVGEPITTWLSVDPVMGTITPGNLSDISVTANSTGLDEGTYTADVVVASNDLANPSVVVSVTLVVSGGSNPPVTIAELTFEEQDDFAQIFDPWTVIDVDAGATYGFTGTTFPGAFDPMAYIAFNPATTEPPMIDDPEIQPYAGERFGACFATVPPPFNDDWMISPQVQLGDNSLLNFYVKSYTGDYGLEKYNVGVSTTGMNPGDFTMLNTGVLEAPVVWTEETFDLSAYDGQLVYVAIQCVSEDAFVFMIDNLMITSLTGIEDNEVGNVSIYPNPATGFVNIESADMLKSVSLINYTGQVVYQTPVNNNQIRINTNDLPTGVYFVRMETANGISNHKLIIK